MDYLIGIDIGTTSTKAVALGAAGGLLAEASRSYPTHSPCPGHIEQDPEEIFGAVLQVLKEVVDRLGGKQPLAVSFSSAMHSLIALGADGQPLSPCLIWADTRSEAEAARLRQTPAGQAIYEATGMPIHPMTPLCKLLWLRKHQAPLFARTHKFVSIKEYALFRLFGSFFIDYSLASATGLFHLFRRQWHEESLAVVGITAAQLSDPVPPTHLLRGLSARWASVLGLKPQVPFVLGSSDGAMANLGANALGPGRAAVTLGTSGAIRVFSPTPVADRSRHTFSTYLLDEEACLFTSPISNGGIALRWFRDAFGGPEVAAARQQHLDPYDLLSEVAAQVPPGAGGLLFLPYLLGERAPVWDANARGVFFGVNVGHGRAHFLRAVLEGVIYSIYHAGQDLQQLAGEAEVICANGGFARSRLWVQLLADVFNKPVQLTASQESSAIGAALLGLKALGVLADFSNLEPYVPVAATLLPDPHRHAIYQRHYALFGRLYGKLKEEFALLQELQGGMGVVSGLRPE
jgi:gluconokinase